jgi:hypothetical protein
VQIDELDMGEQKNCGTTSPGIKLPEVVIENMKLVFRKTHAGEMTQEDRDFLGIPPCAGECCP